MPPRDPSGSSARASRAGYCAALVAKGARAATSPADAARADFIILSLNSAMIVEHAVFGEEGVAEAGEANKLLIDMSSIDTEATRYGAPPQGAEWRELDRLSASRRLTVMAGASSEDFERRPEEHIRSRQWLSRSVQDDLGREVEYPCMFAAGVSAAAPAAPF